jgi:hypothetical protein
MGKQPWGAGLGPTPTETTPGGPVLSWYGACDSTCHPRISSFSDCVRREKNKRDSSGEKQGDGEPSRLSISSPRLPPPTLLQPHHQPHTRPPQDPRAFALTVPPSE